MAYGSNTSNSVSNITGDSGGSGSGSNSVHSGASVLTSRVNGFSDLNLQMIPHPQKKDIIPLKDNAAVKNAVRNLLITNFYERPFQPTMGANLRGLLFEPADAITRLAIKDGIKNCLEEFEPRIENLNIFVETTRNESEYRLTVIFSIKQSDSVEEVEINLQRIR